MLGMRVGHRYRLDALLGRGLLFEAYRAHDRLLNGIVFLKLGREDLEEAERAMLEAHVDQWRRFAMVDVPGVPAIVDIGAHQERRFVVTRWIDGHPLRDLVDQRLPMPSLAQLLDQGLAILAELERAHLVHGDISPSNLMVNRDGRLYLIDPAPRPLRADGGRMILGNPAYAAPEVVRGDPLTPAADVYALGAVLGEAAARLGVAAPPQLEAMTAPFSLRPAASALAAQANGPGRGAIPAPRAMSVDPWAPGAASSPLAGAWTADSRLLHDPPQTASFDTSAAPESGWNARTTLRREPGPPLETGWTARSALYDVPMPAVRDAEPIRADFTVFAPGQATAGQTFFVELWVAPGSRREEMLAQAATTPGMTERASRSFVDLARDAVLTVMLQLPDFEVPEPVETLGWNGDIRNAGFLVRAPAALGAGVYPGRIKLLLAGTPFASIAFELRVGEADAAVGRLPLQVRRIVTAFASYASADRAEVLRRVQGIQATGVDVFVDIVGLRAGEAWESTLMREIEMRDTMFLFWSRSAARSEWVQREWAYALDQRGIDFINPLALEDPRLAAPPAALAGKHFNDMLLAFMSQEEAMRSARRSGLSRMLAIARAWRMRGA